MIHKVLKRSNSTWCFLRVLLWFVCHKWIMICLDLKITELNFNCSYTMDLSLCELLISKGIVHPKNGNFFLLLNTHKRRIFEKLFNQTVAGCYWLHSIFGSQWLPTNVWLPTFFKISSFVLNGRKKLMRVRKWQNLNFWVNYPFKSYWPQKQMFSFRELNNVKCFLI